MYRLLRSYLIMITIFNQYFFISRSDLFDNILTVFRVDYIIILAIDADDRNIKVYLFFKIYVKRIIRRSYGFK